MPSSTFGTFGNRLTGFTSVTRSSRGASVAAALIAAGALTFDAMTPQIISVGTAYLCLTLIGYWFPEPKASLGLALLATALIILGYWITVPDITPPWQAWLNRALACCTVWLTAVFVWRIRVLEQKLQLQIDLANSLSHEMEHRIANHLQLVASFLGLQAKASCNEEFTARTRARELPCNGDWTYSANVVPFRAFAHD